jgi:hypothetical protein
MTSGDSEAQFEAQLRAAIVKTFPWLPSTDVKHQTSFTFKFGRATAIIEGTERNYVRARADVLVNFRGAPLCVFELKRDGEELSQNDYDQCLSYARMQHPRPPLAVVSNGVYTIMLETHTGSVWQPTSASETALAALIEAGNKVAQLDLKQAIKTLMGNDSDVWMAAVRAITQHELQERTGDWNNPIAPFVGPFLLPRKASAACHHLLKEKQRLILVEGAPLSGKSNVLREVALRASKHPDMAMLYLDADGGGNLFERLALILSDALEWPVTSEEAKHWLRLLSRSEGPALVLLVDNLGPDRDGLRQDLDILSGGQFGDNLRIVAAADDAISDLICRARNGRGPSQIGRRAVRLPLGALDNQEFEVAMATMEALRLTFVDGAFHSPELRAPWIIRAMAEYSVSSPNYANKTLNAAMSPVPGLELLEFARKRFDVSQSPFNLYRELAKAVLAEGQDRSKPYELVLELLQNFIVRRTTALAHVSQQDVATMISAGLIRESRSASGENILVMRVPELMATEVAVLMADEVRQLSKIDSEEAAAWLAGAAGNLPLGDIIAADALVNIIQQGTDLGIIAKLRMHPPKFDRISPGTKVAMYVPNAGIINIVVEKDGKIFAESSGGRIELSDDDVAEFGPSAISDIHPYLILAHLAGHPMAVANPNPGSNQELRLDPDLLTGVGSCPVILRRPGGDPDLASVPSHELHDELSIVCHAAGVVEPITWSFVRFFGREDLQMRDQFLDWALEEPNLPLVARMDIALRQTASSSEKKRAKWATAARARLKPLLKGKDGDLSHEGG